MTRAEPAPHTRNAYRCRDRHYIAVDHYDGIDIDTTVCHVAVQQDTH
ncbi:hypothetical protein GCM10010129_01450 [Streptomyces fumigatiscleroticus]|nr:hypothetical protein GCM10010129_01450 [Streptomyces fumigatiscleroticus]